MTIPYRGTTGDGTYFVAASTFHKKALLQSERMARLFVKTLVEYRDQRKYELHEYVVMPDHFHVLITPIVTLAEYDSFKHYILRNPLKPISNLTSKCSAEALLHP
jgi:REP element-mobilizing transposase RayT